MLTQLRRRCYKFLQRYYLLFSHFGSSDTSLDDVIAFVLYYDFTLRARDEYRLEDLGST